MSSPRVTTVPLPPAKGRSIGGDSRHLTSQGMSRKVRRRDETGENSRPTNGEDSTPAHKAQVIALEKAKTEKEAHGEFESEHPGYCGAQDTFYVGNLKGVGRIYQQTF